MNQVQSSQPIGIFDSGIGGLTVAHAITRLLPNESIVYFGDTAYLPYGDKSADIIQERALKICDFLIQKQCKLIVIACNSASAVAFDLISERYQDKIKIINVIDPIVNYVGEHHVDCTVGLIGTWCTINSNVYLDKLNALGCKIKLKSLATPLLAPMIEKGFCHDKVIQMAVDEYLSDESLSQVESLILGCTHYPIIKSAIEKFYHNLSFPRTRESSQKRVDILDSPGIVATMIKDFLIQSNLINSSQEKAMSFYVSDLQDHFAASAQQFFGSNILLEGCFL
jgi:glutamate racemase